jgi:hypothetical protein
MEMWKSGGIAPFTVLSASNGVESFIPKPLYALETGTKFSLY